MWHRDGLWSFPFAGVSLNCCWSDMLLTNRTGEKGKESGVQARAYCWHTPTFTVPTVSYYPSSCSLFFCIRCAKEHPLYFSSLITTQMSDTKYNLFRCCLSVSYTALILVFSEVLYPSSVLPAVCTHSIYVCIYVPSLPMFLSSWVFPYSNQGCKDRRCWIVKPLEQISDIGLYN